MQLHEIDTRYNPDFPLEGQRMKLPSGESCCDPGKKSSVGKALTKETTDDFVT
eukprot:m.312302 g.312302  ORF g.312302 m.312302 type:complete len:53 (+) comp245796_c0_seq1:953-1111(+)